MSVTREEADELLDKHLHYSAVMKQLADAVLDRWELSNLTAEQVESVAAHALDMESGVWDDLLGPLVDEIAEAALGSAFPPVDA